MLSDWPATELFEILNRISIDYLPAAHLPVPRQSYWHSVRCHFSSTGAIWHTVVHTVCTCHRLTLVLLKTTYTDVSMFFLIKIKISTIMDECVMASNPAVYEARI